ncbi:glycerophosphodiester phosphodiesterase [Auraticoccus sp. F435]|uniref:Glycerophosphodiester phosphodiesterase n=2 Tax=Auraticoccus cholistanensis TaxID=2656650 RepID=A0A6A9UQD5_9ACTN|nr:glycerophosphodiester phosphodiesterase family protein [Auraticoccus cholistanensis]MVA75106.1 glycerophosphodiester phosphodiesterase [Auraticoccus cholistanensis]
MIGAATALLVLAVPSLPAAAAGPEFDLQAHRGGVGLTTESTPEAFAKALELGVSTLELDTQLTADGHVVVTHDRQISATKCRDTGPVTADDPQYPYVGRYVVDLTLEQVQSVDCGIQAPGHPDQEVVEGARIVELREVFDVVRAHGAEGVRLNIETKVEAGAPRETAPRGRFVRAVAREVQRSGMADQVTIQSFDWGALQVMHRVAPELPLVALTNGSFLEVGQPGRSRWLGGLDVDDFDGNWVAAADTIPGVTAVSPVQGNPQGGAIGDPDFVPFVTAEMVRDAHERGLDVIPWTVDDPETMAWLIDLGVDGIITDYPDRLRQVMADKGLPLPKPYPAP